jgi:hypothetical protein
MSKGCREDVYIVLFDDLIIMLTSFINSSGFRAVLFGVSRIKRLLGMMNTGTKNMFMAARFRKRLIMLLATKATEFIIIMRIGT